MAEYCTCGHKKEEHGFYDHHDGGTVDCSKCSCTRFRIADIPQDSAFQMEDFKSGDKVSPSKFNSEFSGLTGEKGFD